MTPPTTVDMAFALLREGRLVDAQELMVREVQEAEKRHGRGSPQWASARCDLGNVLLNSDQLDGAIECYRDACSGPMPADHEARKDRLTYGMNLGMALGFAGRLDEAEAELRRNLQERLAFYGREHPGYAFGLQALADALLHQGKTDQAREVIEETVANFWRNGHERVAEALAARAEIMKAGGAPEHPFPGLDQLPDEIVAEMAAAVTSRVGRADPSVRMPVLRDLVAALEARLGAEHQATLNALSVLANTARESGDHRARIQAISRVLAVYDHQGRAEDAANTALGLALAQSDAGDLDGALRTYEEARTRADRVGRPELTSQVLRNWGLALADADRHAEAEQRMREAVEHGRRGADHEMLGQAHIALGLFLQHRERLDEARQVLQEGLAVMDPAHQIAIIGRSHLGAIEQGRSCGCGALEDTIGAAFRDFLLPKLPAGLLADLDVTVQDGEFKVGVHLAREPAPGEIEQLDRVLRSATAEFRSRLGQTG